MRLTKEEAWELAHKLLDEEILPVKNKCAFHFGRVEIKYLLDAIYGEDDEKWKPQPKDPYDCGC